MNHKKIIDPIPSIALLSRIFETHRQNIKFDEKRSIFEIPIFTSIEKPSFDKLLGYEFQVYDIVREVKPDNTNCDTFLRVVKVK